MSIGGVPQRCCVSSEKLLAPALDALRRSIVAFVELPGRPTVRKRALNVLIGEDDCRHRLFFGVFDSLAVGLFGLLQRFPHPCNPFLLHSRSIADWCLLRMANEEHVVLPGKFRFPGRHPKRAATSAIYETWIRGPVESAEGCFLVQSGDVGVKRCAPAAYQCA